MENTLTEITPVSTIQPPLKPWYAPQITVVDVAEKTQLSASPGADGAGVSSLS